MEALFPNFRFGHVPFCLRRSLCFARAAVVGSTPLPSCVDKSALVFDPIRSVRGSLLFSFISSLNLIMLTTLRARNHFCQVPPSPPFLFQVLPDLFAGPLAFKLLPPLRVIFLWYFSSKPASRRKSMLEGMLFVLYCLFVLFPPPPPGSLPVPWF